MGRRRGGPGGIRNGQDSLGKGLGRKEAGRPGLGAPQGLHAGAIGGDVGIGGGGAAAETRAARARKERLQTGNRNEARAFTS